MTTSLDALVQLLPLSICVALTGLLTPIALSFILTPAFGFPLVHAFAAGSALSSTSLGTILAVLQPRVIGFDLRSTRLGVVLLSAAVMDDVVAFILAKILTILGFGSDGSGGLGEGIGRVIGVTVGLAVVFVPIARWILRPTYDGLMARRERWEDKSWGGQGLVFVIMACIWIGMIAAAGFGGTSPLYGAYLAGLITSYLQRPASIPTDTPAKASTEAILDSIPVNPIIRAQSYPMGLVQRSRPITSPSLARSSEGASISPTPEAQVSPSVPDDVEEVHDHLSFVSTFDTYLFPVMTYLLLPLFFGSIGYSIPFVALWTGETIWRGLVYAILMIFGKIITGIWLVVWPVKKDPGEGRGWRAGLFLGLAMVARGEIGLL